MNIQELIFNLCAARGVSGDESAAAAVAARYLSAFADVTVDRSGSVTAVCGNPSAEKTILLDAHLDQIGLIVTDINENGFVKVAACGGIDVRTLQNEVFETKDGARGTVCCLPPHLSDGSESKAEPVSKVWLDFGMSREEVREHLAIGDTLTFSEKPEMLLNGRITSPALDNRSGVAAIIAAGELVKDAKDYKVVILLSVQEETYGTGASTGAFAQEPDEAIVVDVSFAAQPDVSGQYAGIELGNGPMIGVAPILNREMTDTLIALAQSLDMPFQYEPIAGSTGTNADKIAVTKSGVKTAMISIPERYMHTQSEVLDPADAENTAKLIAAYILRGGSAA